MYINGKILKEKNICVISNKPSLLNNDYLNTIISAGHLLQDKNGFCLGES